MRRGFILPLVIASFGIRESCETEDTVGQLMVALAAAQTAENTLILFTTDNGGLWHLWQQRRTRP